MDEVQQIKLIKSEIRGYEDALRRNTTITGEPLSAEAVEKYRRAIVELEGKMASILGSMS